MTLGPARPRRKPSLTPMIDVVFLLLVFFMLASRFGVDLSLGLSAAGQGKTAYDGPPRLVHIRPDALALNGLPVTLDALAAELEALTNTPDDTIVLRARDGATLQRVVLVMERLTQSGFASLVLVE